MKRVNFLVLGFALLSLPGLALSETAVYSPTYTAPQCVSATSPCDVPDSLIGGRDTLGGGLGPEWGDEPNQPNTLAASPCADGSEGYYHNNYVYYGNYAGSLDAFQVTDLSGPSFQPGDTVRVDATVWCARSNSFDSLYVYHADSPSSPSWVYAGAAACRDYGTQLLSVIFNLGVANNLQAIRVAFTEYSSASPCDTGPANDRDDVVLTVAGDTGDSDGDGLPNWWEEAYSACVNPLVPDADANPDGDAWTNLQEYQNGGNPCVYNECSDGLDNDGDGLVDLADPGCESAADLSEHGDNACDDGLDNDADGLTDWPNDPDCLDAMDTAELKPSLVGSDAGPTARGFDKKGKYAFYSDGYFFKIIDVSNPAAPNLIGSCSYQSGEYCYGYANDIFVNGNYAYLASGWPDILGIIDISNPAVPKQIGGASGIDEYGNSPGTGYSYGVYVSGKYAYLAEGSDFCGWGDCNRGLAIYDVSDPAITSLIGKYVTPSEAYAVYVRGAYAYVADCESGLFIIDVEDPSAPTLVGTHSTPSCAASVYLQGKLAYVTEVTDGLQIFDISNPANPVLSGSYNTPGTANHVYVSGKFAYVGDGDHGLQIINVLNPAAPILAGSYQTQAWARGVHVSGNYAYVADNQNGSQLGGL